MDLNWRSQVYSIVKLKSKNKVFQVRTTVAGKSKSFFESNFLAWSQALLLPDIFD